MLQKYHPNPLSHFLALHNSQATHNHVVDAHTLATTIANSHSQFHHQQQQQQQLHHHQQQAHHHQQQHHQHHHQQQHQTAAALLAANQQHNTHIQLAAAAAAAQHLNSHNSPNQHLHSPTHPDAPQQHNGGKTNPNHHTALRHLPRHTHTQQLIEAAAAVNTTLDAGKSFTIAAILGLQKSAMENSCKEYTNNVINLSLNGGSNSNSNNSNNNEVNGHGNITSQHLQQQNLSIAEQRNKDEAQLHQQQHQQQHHHHLNHQHQHHSNQRDSLGHNNNNNRDVTNLNVNKSNICNSFHSAANNIITSVSGATSALNHSTNTVNSFNCDNAAAATVLMNRYLPSAMVNVTGAAATPSMASFAATPVMAHQQHSRANSFVAAAAAAAAAAANASGAPSALQSLQQLHQQHAAHQTSLSFQREKLKSESNSKKSSLKNKRVRTIFTPEQLERLEAEFERQQYMVGPERLYLAHTLQLTEAQVKVWFQNRRIKWRKHHLEMTQQRLAIMRQTQIVPGNAEQTPIKIDGTDDDDCDNIKREELRDLNDSRQDTESELSVCNDSMDAESIIDDDEET